jgi:hypothetical protein
MWTFWEATLGSKRENHQKQGEDGPHIKGVYNRRRCVSVS